MSTSTVLGSRYITGQKCVCSGDYHFDGYTDGTSWPSPTGAERKIPLANGNTFPPVHSCNKGCYWKLVRLE